MRDEEGHYIIVKESIQQEDLTIINIYAPNVGAAKYITDSLQTFSTLFFDMYLNVYFSLSFQFPLPECVKSN